MSEPLRDIRELSMNGARVISVARTWGDIAKWQRDAVTASPNVAASIAIATAIFQPSAPSKYAIDQYEDSLI